MRKPFLLLVLVCFLSGCAGARPMQLVKANLAGLAWTAINSSSRIPFPAKVFTRTILGVLR